MAKGRPNGLARGPEAEPADRPLIALLKRDRVEVQAAADVRVLQVITEFTDSISDEIIALNKVMHTSHSKLLAVPVNAAFLGVDIDYQLLLTGISKWASDNGIKIKLEPSLSSQFLRANYLIDKQLVLYHQPRKHIGPAFKVFEIDFSWEAV